MKFDEHNYPCVNGSTDSEDSSHLAGLLAVTNHHQAVNCMKYVKNAGETFSENDDTIWFTTKTIYIRCNDSKYDFSRDQAILLMPGLIAQGHKEYVNLKYITGRDLIPPSVRGLVRIAQGKKPYFYQTKWLTAEIYWHSYLQPLDEPFQLLAMMLTYDNFNGNNELLKLWTSNNNKWRWSILRYLAQLDGAWRGEPELAEYVIKYVESRLNG